MSLASSEDVVARLGRDLTPEEEERVEGLLDEASDLVVAWCRPDGTDFDVVPDPVTRVTARLVARVITSGVDNINLSAQTTVVGPYQRQNTFSADSTSGGPWLNRADKIKLKPFRQRCVQNVSTH